MINRMVVVSFSGGKDSTATALLALDERADVRLVFADTGNEHELTLEYIHSYIPSALGIKVHTLRPDFSARIAAKRTYILEKWAGKGVPQAFVDRAAAAMVSTGVPFLDLCLWKGRFPSRMAQFCTQELKRYPLDGYMLERVAEGRRVESWQGVRRDESQNRKDALDREETPEGWTIVRPIAAWSAARVVKHILDAGLKLNPLYSLGMRRVGCMPCINCGKDELAEIAARFPQHVDRIREWETLVSEATKRGMTTFFTDVALDGETDAELFARLGIDERIRWAKTVRGGRQFDLLKAGEATECSSSYGLCE